MFGKAAFIEGLKEVGIDAQELGEERIAFAYKIKAGRFEGHDIRIGLDVPKDFPVICPSGPHISPRLIPINPGIQTNARSTDSPSFGVDWQYLSRPFIDGTAGWKRTTQDVKAYMHHVKEILESL